MKTFLAISLLACASLNAAIATGTVWEARSGGATANGGGFNPSNSNFMTDLAVAAGEGGNTGPHVSSATYTFVAGDVGAWVYVKTGTGWNSSCYYKISSVSSGIAVLEATTGHGISMTGSAGGYNHTPALVQGVGSSTPGGNATFGVDYSQQDSPILSAGDLACTTPSTTVSSAGAGFRQSMVGNLLKITSMTGTGSLLQWFEVVSYSSTSSVVLDRTPSPSNNGSAGAFKVGGGVASLADISSSTAGLGTVAGNVVFVTQGGGSAFSVGSTVTFTGAGSAANPIQITGYGTYRGDGYLGRNTTDGKLITTNMPSYQFTATNRMGVGGAGFVIVKNINFSVAGAGVSNSVVGSGNGDSILTQCVVTNPSTNTAAAGTLVSARCAVINCDVFMTGASGGATGGGIMATSASNWIIGNRIQMSQSTSTGPAINIGNTTTAGAVIGNVVIGNGGASGIFSSATGSSVLIYGNTVVGFADGLNIITGKTVLVVAINNLITDNTTNAINCVDAGAPVYNAYNRLRDPITVNNGTNYTNISGTGDVTIDDSAYADYVDQSSGDYRLSTGSLARQAALLASASMGARQPAASGGTTTYTEISVGGNGGITVRH